VKLLQELLDLHSPVSVLESIYSAQNQLKITLQHDRAASDKDIISTFFKKIPYISNLKGSPAKIYSVLNYVSNEETTKLLTSLKGKGPYEVPPKQVTTFLHQAAAACKHAMDDVKPDLIIYPRSSSKLVKSFVTVLGEMYRVKVVDEGFVKSDLKDVNVDDMINTKHPDWEKFASSPKAVAELKRSLAKHLKGGELELKKVFKPHLKFLKNYLKLRDESATLDQVIEKRVLVVDDVLSTGSTMIEMLRQVSEFEPKVVAGLTIFKRTTSWFHP
jgi:hypothetical protein